MQELFLPVLHSFENNNIFTGSYGSLRFRAVPSITMKTPKEVDFEASSVTCEVWYGEYCYQKSTVEDTRTFPLSEEGRAQLHSWLMEHTREERV